MSWEWSHSQEAYDNARENLSGLAQKTLEVIWAEWAGYPEDATNSSSSNLDEERYKAALKQARAMDKDTLVEEIWEMMSELRTCTNGGWEAWCCPFGCQSHMVSFSSKAELFQERMAKARAKRTPKQQG